MNIKSYFKGDKIIWAVVAVLIFISILAVYSSIATIAYRYKGGDTGYYFYRHLQFIFLGMLALFVAHRINYAWLYSLYRVILGIAIFLLIITLMWGVSEYGAKRWADVGIRLQTSDIAKFALVVYIARVLSQHQDNKATLYIAFQKIIVALGIVGVLIFPSNFSTAALVFLTATVMMLIGRIPVKYLAYSIFGFLFIVMLILLITPKGSENIRSDTWKNRISNFVSGNDGTQVKLAKSAIASSHLIGKGPGNSSVKYRLENASSDFIYAIIIEELGSIIGIFFVLAAYLVLLYRTGTLVKSLSNTFPAFLAIGLCLNIVFQALVNMAVAVNLMPVTGQPLPLVSLGGTSMLITMFSLGVILNISKNAQLNEARVDGI